MIKKITLFFLLLFIFSINNTFYFQIKAYDEFNGERSYDQAVQDNTADDASKASWDSKWDTVTVKVTEKIPGAGCGEKDKKTGLYTCTVQPWFKTIQIMIGQIVKWFTAVAALSGVLFIVVNGILLSMDPDNKEKAKGRIKQTLSWLILLLLSGVILSIIAPWVYR